MGPLVPVVVARADIAAGARVEPPMLAVRQVPRASRPAIRWLHAAAGVTGQRAAVAPAGSTSPLSALADGAAAGTARRARSAAASAPSTSP